jgi:hypothetical protein
MTDPITGNDVAAEETPAAEAHDPIEPAAPARPEHVPEKFWDSAAGTLRADALLKSYTELERKLGRMVPLPAGEADEAVTERLLQALGRPASPDGYQIQAPHALVEPDPDLNSRLHAGGFTQKQAQLVYDLAAEHLVPIVQDAVQELEAARQVERLQQHFGGAETWPTIAQQLSTWGRANLEPQVYEALSTSYDGILALHQLMRTAEPELVDASGAGEPMASEDVLSEMMRDPRYWRDRDPDFVARVTRGFRQLYPG